jgi:hypothetical protein
VNQREREAAKLQTSETGSTEEEGALVRAAVEEADDVRVAPEDEFGKLRTQQADESEIAFLGPDTGPGTPPTGFPSHAGNPAGVPAAGNPPFPGRIGFSIVIPPKHSGCPERVAES